MNSKELVEQLKKELHIYNSYEDILFEIKQPPWELYQKIHNWRNYVPECLKQNWGSLKLETRIIVWFLSEKKASEEEWD